MPLYQFICQGCLTPYEVFMKLAKAEKKIRCPECKKILKKIILPVRFKVN
jgi:putative FmdB family regulatory protein